MVDIEPNPLKVIVNKGSDQGVIAISLDIVKYSKVLDDTPNKDQDLEIQDVNINITDLRIINKFYEEVIKNNQNLETKIKQYFEKKINSDKLLDVLPEEVIEFMNKQGWLQKSEDNFIFEELKARNTWDACMVLGFEFLAEIFMQAFCAKYYCPDNEEELKKWCQKHNQPFELTGEQMYQIRMGENKEIFDLIENQEMLELEQQFKVQENAKQSEEEQKQNLQNQ